MTNQVILLVDVGNSSVKWSLLNITSGNHLSEMSQQQYPEKTSASFFVESWAAFDKPAKVLVSCVASEQAWQALQQACDQLWAIQAEKVISVKEGFGIVNAYQQPSELGSDRWCAMIGAYHEIISDLIVVDCGSAITIDVITLSGNTNSAKHLGGYILPGIAMMKKSLGTYTADVKVPDNFTTPVLTPSITTAGCVDSAIYLAAVKLIEAVFEQQSMQRKNIQCLLTGGDAAVVAELLSIKYIVKPDLVLRGLAQIAATNLEN
jgi:type III pantothenate kinase